MPQPKKAPSLRARTNKATTAKTLSRKDTHPVPALPKSPPRSEFVDGTLVEVPTTWHPQTLKWWTAIWKSPLPGAWETFDIPTLYTLALLYDDIWTARTPKERKDSASEYRLQRKDFFIAPYDRLRGEIVFAEADKAKTEMAARRIGSAAAQSKPSIDPRMALEQ